MTALTTTSPRPAILGGAPVFAEKLPLVRPALGETSPLKRRYADILASGILTNGPTVRELEETVAERLGVDHVVGVASCTSGLMLVLQAIGARGPVVLPSFTFAASAHAVAWAGGTPVFAEVSEAALTLDPGDAERAVAESGACAMTATHVYGTPCQTEELQTVADRAGIPLVYDAAHGLGSVRQGTPVGNFGVAEVFSLSPTKVVVAGEGGLIATADADLAHQLRLGRDYGNPGDYDCQFAGLNARMSELHAATALHSLSLLDDALVRRHEPGERLFWSELGEVRGRPRPGARRGRRVDVQGPHADRGRLGHRNLRRRRSDGRWRPRVSTPATTTTRRSTVSRPTPTSSTGRLPLTERLRSSVISPALWSHMTDAQVRGIARAVRRSLDHGREITPALDEGVET